MFLNIYDAILTVICLVIYHNAYHCGFVFDDASAIRDNNDLRPDTPLINLIWNDFWGTPMHLERSHKSYRPLTVLTFRLNYAFGKLDPAGYHLVNIILHLIVTLIFSRFCGNFLSPLYAFFSALLFAVHPIHTEAVTGVVGRAELLSSIFFLLTIQLYKSATRKHGMNPLDWIKLFVCVLLVAVGTLCKEQCITVIGVCCVYEVLCVQKLSISKVLILARIVKEKPKSSPTVKQGNYQSLMNLRLTVIRCLLLVGSTMALLYARIKVMGAQLPVFTRFDNPAAHASFPARQLTYNYLLPINVWLLLCPSHLCCDWTMGTIPLVTSLSDARNLATLLFYCALFSASWFVLTRRNKQAPVVGMALALLALPFIPASNLFFPVGFVVAERVLYTPSMGFCLLIGLGLESVAQHYTKYKKVCHLLFYIVIFLFSWKTYLRNYDWHSEYTLFKAALKVNTRNAKLWNNVGHTFEGTDPEEALKYFRNAVKVQPDDIGAIINVGRTLVNLDRNDEAEETYKQALSLFPQPKKGTVYTTRIAPTHLKVFINLSNLLIKNASRLEEADNYLKRAIAMRPDFIDAYQNRGDILIKLKRNEEAKQQYHLALQYEPQNADLYYNLGVVYLSENKKSEAANYFLTSLKYNPNHEQSLYNAASLLSESSNPAHRAEAKKMFMKVIDNEFEIAQTYFNLAMLETDEKNYQLAEQYYLEALKKDSTMRGSLFNIALLYRNEMKRPDKALPWIYSLLNHHPTHIKGYLLLGDILMSYKKDLNGAYQVFKKAVEVDPSNISARHNVCVVLVELGQLTQSEKCLTELAELAPNEEYIRNHLNIVRNKIKQANTVKKSPP